MNPRPRLTSLQRASDDTGVPVSSLRDLINRGVLPSVRLPHSRRVWLDTVDLDRLISQSKASRTD